MNMITCPSQRIHDIYVGTNMPGPSGPCLVVYTLTPQGHIKYVCFHSLTNGQVRICFEASDIITEQAWLDLRTDQTTPPKMSPFKVDGIDTIIGFFTCTKEKYQNIFGEIDSVGCLHRLNAQGNIDRVCMLDPLDGNKVTIKAIISNPPTEEWWGQEMTASSIAVNDLEFDTP